MVIYWYTTMEQTVTYPRPPEEQARIPEHLRKTVEAVSHLIFWPVYLTSLFPIQVGFYALRYIFKRRVFLCFLSPYDAVVWAVRHRNLLWPPSRLGMLFRATWVYTPSAVFPWMYQYQEIEEDPSGERDDDDRWDYIRSEIYQRDGYTCLNCGARSGPDGDEVELHADHIIPKSVGGGDSYQNLRTLCRHCHEARHGRRFD